MDVYSAGLLAMLVVFIGILSPIVLAEWIAKNAEDEEDTKK